MLVTLPHYLPFTLPQLCITLFLIPHPSVFVYHINPAWLWLAFNDRLVSRCCPRSLLQIIYCSLLVGLCSSDSTAIPFVCQYRDHDLHLHVGYRTYWGPLRVRRVQNDLYTSSKVHLPYHRCLLLFRLHLLFT